MTEYHDLLAIALLGCPVLGLSLAGTMYKVLQFIGSDRGTPAKKYFAISFRFNFVRCPASEV